MEQKKSPATEIKAKKHELKTLTKAAKDDARGRFRIVKGQIKALEKLEKERDERIVEVNRRADRETAEANEAIADLQRICADPDETCRYFAVAEKGEIEENEFNLNLPRYVDTFEPEEEIDLSVALKELTDAERNAAEVRAKLQTLLSNSKAAQ
jgi:type I restriction enzyme M protein